MSRAGRRLALAVAAALGGGCARAPSAEALERTGREVFTAKCWGCHHERHLAFGPSFQWIGRHRPEALIRAQLRDPQKTSVVLGYARSAMPKIPLTDAEVEGVVAFIRRAGREQ